MPLLRWSVVLPTVLLATISAQAQPSDVVQTEEVRAQLVAHAPDGMAPGKALWLGLLIRHAPEWHTYWKNPGDSGLPTTLEWKLPAGVSAGAIQWPTPKRLPVGPLINYGYEGTVLLPVAVTVTPAFQGTRLDVGLNAEWLVCKEVCIPQQGEFRLGLPAAASTVAHADAFRRAHEQTPQTVDARTQLEVTPQALSLRVDGLPAALHGKALQVFAADAGVIDHAARIEQRWERDRLALRVPLSTQRSEAPPTLRFVLAADAQAVEIGVPVANWPSTTAGATPGGATADSAQPAPVAGASLWLALAFAFVGGVLLNLMPCVFPVLSLKVIGFARHAEQRRLRVAGGLAYTTGVVLSFVALAGVLLAMRAAGDQLGWGFQLQSPLFVAALALLFTLIGFNLLGMFQLSGVLPGRIAALRSTHPVVDHGLTGVLAVAVASPCTAPFMGAALGAALTLPNAQALAVFAVLGLGMAAPYLAACLWPGLSRALPRPGAWMARFKTAMAFPMFATVVWLLWVLGQQVGIDGAAALLALLVALAFVLWVWSEFGARRIVSGVARTAALALLLAVAAWMWPALHADDAPVHAADAASTIAHGAAWQPWSPEAFARVRAENKPVFVDFTAAWCVTCQMNKRLTLGTDAVMDAFRAHRVVTMRADWTRRDPAITDALRALGRSGVPVYALYAPGANEPQLLSEVLTVAEIRKAIARLPEPAPPRDSAAATPRLP